MKDLLAPDDGKTPLTPEELDELIPTWITQRSELNELEQQGILAADVWAFNRKRKDLLTEKFMRTLHRRMLGEVWRWAGQYRSTARNIGVNAWKIPTELRNLLDDVNFWIENGTFSPDEIATRFHHRLVWIHPFPNGNGRFSRLMADLLAVQLGQARFTWGKASLIEIGETRKRYIDALQAADRHDFSKLIAFIRS